MRPLAFAAGIVLAVGQLAFSGAGTGAKGADTAPTEASPHAAVVASWQCYPDVNGDTMISVADIGWVVHYFGQTVPPAPATADLTGDGMVSIGDIGVLVQAFGQICWFG